MVRVRFAPSPTGSLHLGNARTALLNYLFARQNQGRFILRIEDTDLIRSEKRFEAEQIEMLGWMGFDWDEGPDKDGDFGPYRQSERLDIYQEYADQLVEAGRAYPCYCTEEELAAHRQACLKQKRPPRYSGRCRDLTEDERKELEAQGRPPALRFKVEPERIIFRDLIRGRVEFKADEISDFIIVRATGKPAYNFAVVIDDHLMAVSHVIRGADHLANTPRQIMLYKFFGWEPPVFAHHSLLLGPDKSKLSKRHGATTVAQMREKGLLPEALVNYLAFIGGGLRSADQEVLPPAELAAHFDLDNTGRAGAVFDYDKLNWFNGQHLRGMEPEELTKTLINWWQSLRDASGPESWSWVDGIISQDRDRIVEAVKIGRENAANLGELSEWVRILNWELEGVAPKSALLWSGEALSDLAGAGPEGAKVIEAALSLYAKPDWLSDLGPATGLKGRSLYHPLRLALTGRAKGPQLNELISFLTPDQVRTRLEAALAIVNK